MRTHLGYGSPHKQDTFHAHGSPLGAEELRLTKEHLGWPTEPPLYIPEAVRVHFLQAVVRGAHAEADWKNTCRAYAQAFPELEGELQQRIRGELRRLGRGYPRFPADAKGMATRVASGKIMNAVAPRLPALIGGSADLDPSTHTALQGLGDFEPCAATAGDQQGCIGGGWSYAGRNLHFGVREHAMGSIVNGLAAHGACVPYAATFLVFSDYMHAPIRLAALMDLHVVYVFTHDSIALGEDGSTHRPVEQLASLRAIPGLTVIRPADANETAVAWRVASANGLQRGAYAVADAADDDTDLILVASGSEVALILQVQQKLLERKLRARVVAMPSWELFEAQPGKYSGSVLPPAVGARLAVEADVFQGWHRYIGDRGDVLAVDRFGTSAPGNIVMGEYGFTVDNVCRRAASLLESRL